MRILLDCVRKLETNVGTNGLLDHLTWYANTAYLVADGRVEAVAPGFGQRRDQKTSVKATPPVLNSLEWAASGITHDDLEKLLMAEYGGLTREAAREFVLNLVSAQLLVSDLRPPQLIDDPLSWVLSKLQRAGGEAATGESAELLANLRSAAVHLDEHTIGAGLQATRSLNDLATQSSVPLTRTAARIDTSAGIIGDQIGRDITRELLDAALTLFRTSGGDYDHSDLPAVHERMVERFGSRVVPLLELTNRWDGLDILDKTGGHSQGPKPRSQEEQRRSTHLLRIAERSLADRQIEYELTSEDISHLDTMGDRPLPPSFDVFAIVSAHSIRALNTGDFSLTIGPRVAQADAFSSFTRFFGLLPEASAKTMVEFLERERSDRNRLHVELSYMPIDGSSTNVAIRPMFKANELTLGVPPGPETAGMTSWRDVGLQASHTGLKLWSMEQGIPLEVHSTHLLNSATAPPLARFILEVTRSQYRTLRPFGWGEAEILHRLPRLRHNRTTLRPAQWRLTETFGPKRGTGDLKGFASRVAEWRERWAVPAQVAIVESDNILPLDLDDPACLDLLLHEARKRWDTDADVIVQEVAHITPGAQWLEDENQNRYVCEVVVPYSLNPEGTSGAAAVQAQAHPTVPWQTRNKPPGSEWLTMKLYGQRGAQDDLLRDHVRPFSRELESRADVDKWFFIRYSDPDPHLRVRIRFNPAEATTETLDQRTLEWATGLLSRRLVANVQLDTYVREIERYGGSAAIDLCESVFMVDSRTTCDVLSVDPPLLPDREDDRAVVACYLLERLVRSFIPLPEDRRALFGVLASSPLAASIDSGAREQYRNLRPHLERLLGGNPPVPDEWVEVKAAAVKELSHVAKALASVNSKGTLSTPLSDIVGSLAHMHCNRLGLKKEDELRAYRILELVHSGLQKHWPEGLTLVD